VTIASDLFALAGTAAVDDSHNLHRHWRNARTITLHDPARWKYHHVGNHVVNGTFPPPSAYV
jgi:alkylation response protein AidB-like acyl-CoA dehydrogenase